MTKKSKAIVKSSVDITRFSPKVRKELIIRGLTALDEVRDADFYFFKGEEHSIKGEFRQAIESFEKAIELDPEIAEYYSSLGKAQYDLMLYEEAVESHKKAVELGPEVAEYYSNLGLIQYVLGLSKEAIESY